MSSEYILQTEGLTKEFKGFTAVKNVSLNVRRGTIGTPKLFAVNREEFPVFTGNRESFHLSRVTAHAGLGTRIPRTTLTP